jgi:DNA mismatch repair ATPase MutS
LNSFHEYLKGILQQILDSYQILSELNDKPEDLQTINQEFSKIKGFLQVIKNKLSEKKYQSDNLVTLYKLSSYYIENYDFVREINLLSKTYSNDPNRLKNIRLVIIQSLNDRKLIEKFQTILNKL